jgi:hypothetical protein
MYGQGRGRPAYVGIAKKLKPRVRQHLVLRDSSVTTGSSVVALNAEEVRVVEWWQHPSFGDKVMREAAELLAFEVLRPALTSRGTPSETAKQQAARQAFRADMEALFGQEPSGRYLVPTLADAIERVERLERRLEELEAGVAKRPEGS